MKTNRCYSVIEKISQCFLVVNKNISTFVDDDMHFVLPFP